MHGKATALALLLLAGSTSVSLAHEQKLEGSEWGVIGDDEATGRFISFAGENRLFGFGGCNRLTGTYEQHDSHLTISPVATTKMACAPDVMAREEQLLDVLAKVRGVRVDHTLLLLLGEDGTDLRTLTRRGGE